MSEIVKECHNCKIMFDTSQFMFSYCKIHDKYYCCDHMKRNCDLQDDQRCRFLIITNPAWVCQLKQMVNNEKANEPKD